MWLLRRGGFASASGVWAPWKPWGNHGETMGKPWGNHGKMGISPREMWISTTNIEIAASKHLDFK
jgi:hypothetical protein